MTEMLAFMLPPLVAALVLVGIHGYLGVHIIARGVIFVDLALAQVAALGYTVAVLVGLPHESLAAFLIGVGATLVGALILSFTRIEHDFITQEAIIGVVYVAASAATILLAAQAPRGSEHVEHLLTGTLLWVTWEEIAKITLVYAAIGAVHWALRRRFLTISLHPEEAERSGWKVAWWDFLFYGLFGIVVTSSVAVAGVLVVFTFLVIPAVIAFLFTRRPGALIAIAWATGTLATVVGLYLSYTLDLPTGPLVVVVFAATLLLAFGVRKATNRETPSSSLQV